MIGIIGAMDEEVAQIVEVMTIEKEETKAQMNFKQGKLNGKDVVVVRSGIGKVNAAVCTQILADDFKVDYVINTGIAGEPLPGAVFGLFRADCTDFTEKNALLTAESAEDGSFSFENIPYGVWLVREIAAPEGYVLSDEIFTVQICENNAVIELGNLENKPITGELELTKKDISDGKLLPGAGFRIKDTDGNVVAEEYTDENGLAKFTLRYGKYTYEEFDAPEGYRIDTTPHEFEITEDGQIVKAEMTNEKIPTPDVPQTGDESNLGFWIGLGSIALGGAIACGILFAKRKKDDDSDE